MNDSIGLEEIFIILTYSKNIHLKKNPLFNYFILLLLLFSKFL